MLPINNDAIMRLCRDDGHTFVSDDGTILSSAADSPYLETILTQVQSLPMMTGKKILIHPASTEQIHTLLDINIATEHQLDESELGQYLKTVCQTAVNDGASDIHIEVERESTRFLIRVDGRRVKLTTFENGNSALNQPRQRGIDLASYIFSTLGHHDINEREPANDSFHLDLMWQGQLKKFEWRAALMPLNRGIKVTLRCLTPRDKPLTLNDMDLPQPFIDQLLHAIHQRGGGVVITGPMGSGKTSLIYALLDNIDSTARSVHALEDPVEFEQKGICKTAVEPDAETKLGSGVFKDFAYYAKEQLRHDVDVAPFGELRDHAAAKQFCRKAETGGLAITTLHTNSALGIPQTFIEQMAISPSIIAAPDLMRLFVHQKLVRKLCPHCALSHSEAMNNPLTQLKAQRLSAIINDTETARIKHPNGCEKCHYLGEKGRLVVMELIVLDDNDRDYIARKAYLDWKRHLKKQGWPDIRDHALSRLRRGQIDIDAACEQINDLEPVTTAKIYSHMQEALSENDTPTAV